MSMLCFTNRPGDIIRAAHIIILRFITGVYKAPVSLDEKCIAIRDADGKLIAEADSFCELERLCAAVEDVLAAMKN